MKWRHDEQGSLTLEAALILPWFLAFVLALMALIQLSVADISLRTAVSETAQQISTHMYPVQVAFEQLKGIKAVKNTMEIVKIFEERRKRAEEKGELSDDVTMWISIPILTAVVEIKQAVEDGYKSLEASMANTAMKPLVLAYADKTILDEEKLEIVKVDLPRFIDKSRAYIGIEAQYKQKLFVPFFDITVNIRKKSYERVWLGN